MHPDLRLSKLAHLPLHIRRLANAACAPIHSPQDVEHFVAAIPHVPESQTPYLMPALYHLLDPAYLPSIEELDNPLAQTDGAIHQIFAIVGVVYSIPFSLHLGPDLWPRIWHAVKFIYTYREQIPGVVVDEAAFCTAFLFFAGHLHNKRGAASFMLTEPGFYFMIARAFKYVFDIQTTEREALLRDLCDLLLDPITSTSASFEEFLDGVDGLYHLAHLLVRYLSYVLDTREAPLSGRDKYFLRTILSFIVYVDRLDAPVPGVLGLFSTPLRSHGVVSILAKAVFALGETPGADTLPSLEMSFAILAQVLSDGSGHHWIPSAVESGLLRAIVSCANLHPEVHIWRQVRIVVALMTLALTNYHVVAAIDEPLHELATLTSTPAFRDSEIYEQWQKFTELVKQRVAVLKAIESNGYVCLKACDNLECCRVANKADFQRCSGCLTFYYCSKDCQIAD
ncbi:hypothetical protein DFH09DRAFT_407644 [Mycena vulgaris]|nr:hypothetical protein DFH09DRAFT_407644 [Mycena vulgaris]